MLKMFLISGGNADGATTYAAQVRLTSTRPIIVLEDFEHVLSAVDCTPDSIRLSQPDAAPRSLDEIHALEGGHIITSHFGCNKPGERQPYRIVAVEDNSDSVLSLSVVPVKWKASFDSLEVEVGYSTTAHDLRTHDKLFRRRIKPRQVAAAYPFFNLSMPPPLTVPALTASASGSSYSFDVGHSLINTKIGPFQFPNSQTEVPLQIGCVNCTSFGTVDLSFGKFRFSDTDGVSGQATVSATGLGAHVELSTSLSKSWQFTWPFYELQASHPFKIAGMLSINLGYADEIAGGYTLNGSVGMTYGFDMRVSEDFGLSPPKLYH